MAGRWTEQEENMVRENYRTKCDADLAAMIGRPKSCVAEKRRALGLGVKTHTWSEAEKDIIREHIDMNWLELAKFFPYATPAQVNSARAKIKLAMVEPEPVVEKVVLDGKWKPSFIMNVFDDELKSKVQTMKDENYMLAAKIQHMLTGVQWGAM